MSDNGLIKDKIDELLTFQAFLKDADKNEFILWEEKHILHEQHLDKGQVKYSEKLKRFFFHIYNKFWTDPHYNKEKCEKMLSDPRRIQHAGLDDIRALFTDSVHQEEYSIGYWIKLIKNGTMLQILRRLEEIKQDL